MVLVLEADALAIRLQQEALVRRREADALAFRQGTGGERNICQMDFVNKPRLTGELKEVPGLGEVGIDTLNRSGIFTTYQLIGKFLEVRKGGSNRA